MAIRGTETGLARLVDGAQLTSGLWLGDITDAIGVATFDHRVGAVPEFSFDAVDRGRKLSRRNLLREATTLTVDGDVWQVAAVERSYKGDDIWLTVTARSRLSRRLRNMVGPHAVEKTTPQAWITQKVKKAGGTAVVEPGAGRMRIHQKRNQSVLDVIAELASDTGTEWVEVDGVIYVGTPWWAYQGGTGLPSWNCRVDGRPPTLDVGTELAALEFSSRSSLDDRTNAAEAQLSVEVRRGSRVRPWHLVSITHADDADRGDWLVSGVSWDEVSGSASIDLQRPLKSHPKKGSQGTTSSTGTGGDADALDGEWIKDADKVWPRCGRTPRQAVAWALARVGQGFADRQCLHFVSLAFGKSNLGGGAAYMVWANAPTSATLSPGNTHPPIGALVVWGTGAGQGAGHIGISIGNGKMVNASGGRIFTTNIAGFTGDYKGAMTPSFWTGG
ncbi:MAG: CHAP domain-containing protein [Candidatus Nanopelagicales bacterium]